MRNTSKALDMEIKNKWPRTAQSLSYQSIAGGLASEMVDFLSSHGVPGVLSAVSTGHHRQSRRCGVRV